MVVPAAVVVDSVVGPVVFTAVVVPVPAVVVSAVVVSPGLVVVSFVVGDVGPVVVVVTVGFEVTSVPGLDVEG